MNSTYNDIIQQDGDTNLSYDQERTLLWALIQHSRIHYMRTYLWMWMGYRQNYTTSAFCNIKNYDDKGLLMPDKCFNMTAVRVTDIRSLMTQTWQMVKNNIYLTKSLVIVVSLTTMLRNDCTHYTVYWIMTCTYFCAFWCIIASVELMMPNDEALVNVIIQSLLN